MVTADDIKKRAYELAPQVVTWRRHLHQYPEVGFQEKITAEFIGSVLEKLGLEVHKGISQTGVIGVLKGKGVGPSIALRADIDALPIMEETGFEFASTHTGCMHACGHDAHTAMLLGTAKILTELRADLLGDVVFIFQPSEERHPGGAIGIVEAGIFEEYDIKAVYGLHCEPHLPVGTIGVKNGPLMAAADMFELVIEGKGGHGAAPHLTVDPVVTSAQVILALQTIASRRVNPVEPVVVTVASIHAGQAGNVIPQEARLKGTVRSLDQNLNRWVAGQMEQLIKGICQGVGATYQFLYETGYPPVNNHPVATDLLRRVGGEVVGTGRVVEIPNSSMGGEDFAYYLQKAPGSFFFLGVRPEGEVYPWHHSKFNLNEEALPLGVAMMSELVFAFQQKPF